MNYILAVVLLLSASPLMSQWRAVQVSSGTDTAIQENFRRASVYSNRKLDRFSNDTLYGQPIFKNGIKFSDSTVLTTTSTIAMLNSTQTFTGINTFTSSATFSSETSTITFSGYVDIGYTVVVAGGTGASQYQPSCPTGTRLLSCNTWQDATPVALFFAGPINSTSTTQCDCLWTTNNPNGLYCIANCARVK